MKSNIHHYLNINKNTITLLIGLLIAISSFAQQGINYKALIKNGNGNVVANQNVRLQFTILDALSGGSPVFQGTHNPIMTDANGIVMANIGEGAQSLSYGAFVDIDWGSQAHYLKVEIDITSGYNFVDMGTTQFMAVPYALNAANVSGLERITESVSPVTGLPYYGWRLKGQDPNSYGDIGLNAVDLSQHTIVSTSLGATGKYSFTTGSNTKASEANSTAMGYSTHASGTLSAAMGYFTIAEARNSVAIGKWNVGGGDPLIDISTDPMFEIGIGTNSLRENALTVLKNGTVTAPSFSIAEINTAGNKALITKEFADSEYLTESSSLVPIAFGTIESNANVLSGTGNFTASINSGVISISVNNETLSVNNTSCVITPYSTAFRTSSIIISGGDIEVRTFNSSGNSAPVTFQFVIYKL